MHTSAVTCRSVEDLSDATLASADVVAVWHTIWLDEPLLSRMSRAKCIVRMGVGYDNVDIEAAGRLGIPVCNIPDYGARASLRTRSLSARSIDGARLPDRDRGGCRRHARWSSRRTRRCSRS